MKGEFNCEPRGGNENALLISKLTAHTKGKWREGERQRERESERETDRKRWRRIKNKAYAPLDKPMNYAK